MENNQITIQPEESYKVIRKSVLTAQSKVCLLYTSRRIVASLKYKDLNEARNDYLKEIEFLKSGILK